MAADPAPSCPPVSFPGLPHDLFYQTQDFADSCSGGWDLADIEAFLGGAQGSESIVSEEKVEDQTQVQVQEQHLPSTEEYMEDLSSLCFQDLGDFTISDLEVPVDMIDYLLG